MDYKRLEVRIRTATMRCPDDPEVWEDYLSLCREAVKEEGLSRTAHDWNHGVARYGITNALRRAALKGKYDLAERFDNLLYRSLLFGARDYFDDYLQAVEYGKPGGGHRTERRVPE